MDKVYWGQETEKALQNFGRSLPLPRAFIKACAEVKQAAIRAGAESTGQLAAPQVRAMLAATDRIIAGELDDQFILPLKQGGAGTSINMNLNEVIAAIAGEELIPAGIQPPDPIEDVNRFQSTNDVIPTALTVYVYRQLLDVEALVIRLQELLITRENEYAHVLMTGRTEMQAALPITLGQVFGGWAGSIERDRWRLHKLKERVRTIALGGTAIGTCSFAPREYVFRGEQILREITELPLSRSQNLVDEISNQDKLAELASGYNLLAQNLVKLSSDLLLYTSSAVGELVHPELQYGSSIMPAKTNPVIPEMVKGLALDVQGECLKISLYSQNGQLQLNPFLPFMVDAFRVIHSSLSQGLGALVGKLFFKLEVHSGRIEENLTRSLVLLNVLLPLLGYKKIKELYHLAASEKVSGQPALKALILRETCLTAEQLDELFHPHRATSFLQKGIAL